MSTTANESKIVRVALTGEEFKVSELQEIVRANFSNDDDSLLWGTVRAMIASPTPGHTCMLFGLMVDRLTPDDLARHLMGWARTQQANGQLLQTLRTYCRHHSPAFSERTGYTTLFIGASRTDLGIYFSYPEGAAWKQRWYDEVLAAAKVHAPDIEQHPGYRPYDLEGSSVTAYQAVQYLVNLLASALHGQELPHPSYWGLVSPHEAAMLLGIIWETHQVDALLRTQDLDALEIAFPRRSTVLSAKVIG